MSLRDLRLCVVGLAFFLSGAAALAYQVAWPRLLAFLSGMSLRFLRRAMVRDGARASQTIGFLYGINVLGAAAGALATPWVFIRHHGIRTAVLAAVAENVADGLCAIGLALWERRARSAPRTETETGTETGAAQRTETETGTDEAPRSFRTWLALYALSGFCALALEILWFRVLDVALKSTAFTFGTLLTVDLTNPD